MVAYRAYDLFRGLKILLDGIPFKWVFKIPFLWLFEREVGGQKKKKFFLGGEILI